MLFGDVECIDVSLTRPRIGFSLFMSSVGRKKAVLSHRERGVWGRKEKERGGNGGTCGTKW